MIPFVDLGRIVGWPALAVDHPHGLGFDRGAVGPFLALNNNFGGIDVLAGLLAFLEVRAGTERLIVHVDDVGTFARLGRDRVAEAVLLDAD